MASTIGGALLGKLGLDDRDFKRGIRQMQRVTDRATKRMGRAFRPVARIVTGLTGKLIALGGVLSAGAFAKGVIGAASTSENLQIRLTALLGSATEGARAFKEMAAFAGQVPFEFQEIMSSATALSGVLKGGVDEIKQVMPIITDLATVSGLTIEETTGQIIKSFSAGIGSADLFRERGISAMLGFQAGATVSAVDTKNQIVAAFEDANSKFRGASKKLATTWTGLMSMVSDRWFQFQNLVADAGFFDVMKGALQSFVTRLEELQASGKLAQIAQRVSDAMIGGVEMAVRGLGKVAGAAARVIDFVSTNPALVQAGLVGLIVFGPGGAAVLATLGGVVDRFLAARFGSTTAFGKAAESVSRMEDALAKANATVDEFNQIVAGGQSLTEKQIENWVEAGLRVGMFSKQLADAEKTLDGFTDRTFESTPVLAGMADGLFRIEENLNGFTFAAQQAIEAARLLGATVEGTKLAQIPVPDDIQPRLTPRFGGTLRGEPESFRKAIEETKQQLARLKRLRDAMDKSKEAMDRFKERVLDVGTAITSHISNAFTDAILGVQTMAQAMKQLGQAIIREVVSALVKAIAKALILKTIMSALGLGGLPLPGLKRGGMISAARGTVLAGTGALALGLGGGIPIMAHPGEAVLNRAAVQNLGGPPAINQINRQSREGTPAGEVSSGSVHVGEVHLSFPGITNTDELRRELPEILTDLRRQGRID